VSEGESLWPVHAAAGAVGCGVLDRLVRFVTEAVEEIGGVAESHLAWWAAERRRAIREGSLSVRVGHRDVLARAPR
jgi:hypothetical protein